MGKRKTHEMFVDEVRSIHGDKYTVIGKFTSTLNKVEVLCNKCKYIWNPNAGNFIYNKSKCPQCNIKNKAIFATHTEEERAFFERKFTFNFYEKHGTKYNIIGKYINASTKISAICDKHGEFKVIPFALNGCKECQIESKSMTHQEFLDRVFTLVGNEYLVISQYVNNHTKVTMLHNSCGNEVKIKPNHFFNSGVRCQHCFSSKGERKIEQFLQNHEIKYEKQHSFKELKSNKNHALRFDFCILKNEQMTLIEYDGRQHFQTIDAWGGEEGFNLLKENDSIKNRFCTENKIRLIRIPYWEFDNIENILLQELCC